MEGYLIKMTLAGEKKGEQLLCEDTAEQALVRLCELFNREDVDYESYLRVYKDGKPIMEEW